MLWGLQAWATKAAVEQLSNLGDHPLVVWPEGWMQPLENVMKLNIQETNKLSAAMKCVPAKRGTERWPLAVWTFLRFKSVVITIKITAHYNKKKATTLAVQIQAAWHPAHAWWRLSLRQAGNCSLSIGSSSICSMHPDSVLTSHQTPKVGCQKEHLPLKLSSDQRQTKTKHMMNINYERSSSQMERCPSKKLVLWSEGKQ